MSREQELLAALDEAISFLEEYGWSEKAPWFRDRKEAIRMAGADTEAIRSEAQRIRKIIAGMGSFTDLPVQPRSGAAADVLAGQKRQGDIADRLYRACRELGA